MCGIAGFVTSRPSNYPASVLERMTAAIAHRGPDGHGYYRDQWAQLGHRRLSIIDVQAGHQPMQSGANWIVYNGEIFNHAALRPELEGAGHHYHTHCDTETILHAYKQYGAACVDRFRGMFAFALWDAGRQRLFCARDRLGIKPFYYFWNGSVFAFASEVKALLEHPDISAVFEDSVLEEYLAFGYGSSENTMFRGIRKLMPGHRLTLDVGGEQPVLAIERYWDVPDVQPGELGSEAEWIAELRRRLEETVRMRLMSDVPLGVFLSGGVDSSLITAMMQKMVPDKVKSFSVGYQEEAFSELGYARQVAEALGTDHHEVRVSMEDFFGALPRMIWHEDEPIAWPSSVSLYFVSQLASRDVKVVLTGEGSDELFGGYGRYGYHLRNARHMEMWKWAPEGVRNLVRRKIQTTPLLSASLRRKVGHTALGRRDTLASLLLDNFYGPFSQEQREALLRPGGGGDPYATYLRSFDSRKRGSLLSRMLYADQKTYLVELLMKQDQMSMAASIESRVPLLDHTLVEFAATIPDSMKIHNGTQKYIFKKAAEGLLPNDIIYKKKLGFPTPMRKWLLDSKADKLYAMLRDPNRFLAAYTERAEVEGLISRHQAGIEDGTDRLWSLINLQLWGDLFLLGRREEWMDEAGARART